MSIINEDRLREFVVQEVKQMKPEHGTHWMIAMFAIIGFSFGVVSPVAVFFLEHRLSRLETIVATDREFSHGVIADGPVVSIQPRAIPESELPKAKEGQP